LLVPLEARPSPLFGPTSISIHDDGNVPRHLGVGIIVHGMK